MKKVIVNRSNLVLTTLNVDGNVTMRFTADPSVDVRVKKRVALLNSTLTIDCYRRSQISKNETMWWVFESGRSKRYSGHIEFNNDYQMVVFKLLRDDEALVTYRIVDEEYSALMKELEF